MKKFNFLSKRVHEIESFDAGWQSSIVNDWNTLTNSEEQVSQTPILKPVINNNRFVHPSMHLAQRLRDLADEMSLLDSALTNLKNSVITIDEQEDEK